MTAMSSMMMIMVVVTNGQRVSYWMGMVMIMMTMVVVVMDSCRSCHGMMVLVVVSVRIGFHSDHGYGRS